MESFLLFVCKLEMEPRRKPFWQYAKCVTGERLKSLVMNNPSDEMIIWMRMRNSIVFLCERLDASTQFGERSMHGLTDCTHLEFTRMDTNRSELKQIQMSHDCNTFVFIQKAINLKNITFIVNVNCMFFISLTYTPHAARYMALRSIVDRITQNEGEITWKQSNRWRYFLTNYRQRREISPAIHRNVL